MKLFGFEYNVDWGTLDSIFRGIDNGDDFPAVSVIESEGDYYLDPYEEISIKINGRQIKIKDGGHTERLHIIL